MTITEEKVEFSLPDRKVKVKPVRRKGGWLSPGHEASFLFKNSYYEMSVATDSRNRIVNPLTDAERRFFESPKLSGLDFREGDLSPSKTSDNYWLSSKARVRLKDEITILDLSIPEDYLLYKILLTCKDTIAPNADEQFNKGSYKFVVVEEDHEIEEEVSKANDKIDAYTEYGSIKKDSKRLRHVLMVMGAKKVARNSDIKFLQAEVSKLVENNPKRFVQTVTDRYLETKILIQEALAASALKKEGTVYSLPSGDVIGNDLSETVEFFNSKKNQEHRILTENRVEQFMTDS